MLLYVCAVSSTPEMVAFRSQCQRAFWQEGVRKAGGSNREQGLYREEDWMDQSVFSCSLVRLTSRQHTYLARFKKHNYLVRFRKLNYSVMIRKHYYLVSFRQHNYLVRFRRHNYLSLGNVTTRLGLGNLTTWLGLGHIIT